jgi:hypothetical protein
MSSIILGEREDGELVRWHVGNLPMRLFGGEKMVYTHFNRKEMPAKRALRTRSSAEGRPHKIKKPHSSEDKRGMFQTASFRPIR